MLVKKRPFRRVELAVDIGVEARAGFVTLRRPWLFLPRLGAAPSGLDGGATSPYRSARLSPPRSRGSRAPGAHAARPPRPAGREAPRSAHPGAADRIGSATAPRCCAPLR